MVGSQRGKKYTKYRGPQFLCQIRRQSPGLKKVFLIYASGVTEWRSDTEAQGTRITSSISTRVAAYDFEQDLIRNCCVISRTMDC